ncbi:hypothetical protein HN011_012358 [Eciton burchellii]|nr:hypothetical protein HN011_012358 [Eciton burchellii]
MQNETLHLAVDSKYATTCKHTCITCGKSYKHKHHLRRHHNFECGIDPKFKCYFCPHKTRYKSSLMKHILARHQHLQEQNLQYNNRQQIYEMHMEQPNHHVQEFNTSANWTIPTLPSTSRIALYTRRLRSMSSNESGRFSGGSGSRFTYGFNDRFCDYLSQNPMAIPASSLMCPQCGRTYKMKRNLRTHMKFECGDHLSLTPREFRRNSHQNDRIFNCHQCSRSYQMRHNLVKHLRFECGGQKHFACSVCPARYTQNGKLRQHMLNAHDIFVPPRKTWTRCNYSSIIN